MFQRDLSAVTLSHFVSHTELIKFSNYYHGIRFVGKKTIVVTTNVSRSSITFTLFYRLSAQKDTVQEAK